MRKWKAENREAVKGYAKSFRLRNPKSYMLYTAKRRAKLRGLDFDIGVDDFEIPINCPIFGFALEQSFEGKPKPNSPSLDRKDPTKGYIRGNVQVISHKANTMKSDATLEELEKLLNYLRK